MSRILKRFETKGLKVKKGPKAKGLKNRKDNHFKGKFWELDFGDFGISVKCDDCQQFDKYNIFDADEYVNHMYDLYESVCYDCLNMCSYCKVNYGVYICNEYNLNYTPCSRTICNECSIHSDCNSCDYKYCSKHSISNSFVLREFMIPEIFHNVMKYIRMDCYACKIRDFYQYATYDYHNYY